MAISRSAHIHVADHTYRPIEGALVSAGDASAYTDEKGHARLEIPAGVEIKLAARGQKARRASSNGRKPRARSFSRSAARACLTTIAGRLKSRANRFLGRSAYLPRRRTHGTKKVCEEGRHRRHTDCMHLNQQYAGLKFSRLTVHSSRDRSRFEGKGCLNFLFPGHP